MKCCRFDFFHERLKVGVWGYGKRVYAVSLSKSAALKMEKKLASFFDVIEKGAPDDRIAVAFANYFSNGIFEPALEPVFLWGTDFQKAVWRQLSSLGRGESTTYGNIAKQIGSGSAARAVGNAVGANPIPILVPCHRVFAANGIGGFSYGIDTKLELLRIENITR